jgi:hypothetical protein
VFGGSECIATFTCDSSAYCCTLSDTLKLIVAGDADVHLHFLRLEEPNTTPDGFASQRWKGGGEVKNATDPAERFDREISGGIFPLLIVVAKLS